MNISTFLRRITLVVVAVFCSLSLAYARKPYTKMDRLIRRAIQKDSIIPGAVLCVLHDHQICYLQAYGNRSVYPFEEEMSTQTIFDLASLSKPLGAGSAAILLCQAQEMDSSTYVSEWLSGYHNDVRIVDLLTHHSGLPAYMGVARLDSICLARGIRDEDRPAFLIDSIGRCNRPSIVGATYRYSCLNFISLQGVIEEIVGIDLNSYLREGLYTELGIDMGWLPKDSLQDIIAPTECNGDECLRGKVHDPLARVMMQGISGNAGIFASAEDVARWAIWFMQLPIDVRERACNAGLWTDSVRIKKCTLRRIQQGLPYQKEYIRCRHTGYTGTSITMIPEIGSAVILLTNRVHPKDKNSLGKLRGKLNKLFIR